MIVINSNSEYYDNMVPTPRDLLNKIHVLQELKTKFTSSRVLIELSNELSDSMCATEAALELKGKTFREIIQSTTGYLKGFNKFTISLVEDLGENFLKKEKACPDAVVAYHGSKSSLLSDIYGELANALNICESEEETILPRLRASIFDRNIQSTLERDGHHDHDEGFRSRFIAASPTLISDIDSKFLENALHFYCSGECIADATIQERFFQFLYELKLPHWDLDQLLRKSIRALEGDFPQNGFIHRIVFHDPDTANKNSYPAHPRGTPIGDKFHMGVFGTTSEFLSVLKSKNPRDQIQFVKKYRVQLDEVQLRILADPKVFSKKDQVTIESYRRLPIDEQLYREKIRRSIIDPILELGLAGRNPGGLFRLSPLAQSLGTDAARLARLADYIFIGTDHPKIWVAYGNTEAVKRALQAGELCPTTTFEREETVLELSLLSGQLEIFQLLFDQFLNFDGAPTETLATKLFALCVKYHQLDAAIYFLDFVNDFYLIDNMLVQACEKNHAELICKIIDVKNKNEKTTLMKSKLDSCVENCLKNQNLEGFILLLEIYDQSRHDEVILEIVRKSPSDYLEGIVLKLQALGYDLKRMEEQLNFEQPTFPNLSYKTYYQSLPEEKRLALPFQKWWQDNYRRMS
jgi:hypothetical protein